MRSFKNIATLIRQKRIHHPRNYSQADLSELLGYKNGQFISNVERGLCNIPLKTMKKISDVLEITPDEIKTAILKDQEETLTNFFNANTSKKLSTDHGDHRSSVESNVATATNIKVA